MPLTQEERRAQTRTLLLTSAAELFARKGFHATSAEAVAAAADRTTGALYNHFDGKEGLLVALLEHWVAQTIADLGPAMEDAADLDDRLGGMWDGLLRRDSESGDAWLLLEFELWLHAVRDPSVGTIGAERFGLMREGLALGVEAWATELGFALPAPAEEVAAQMLGLLVGLAFQHRLDAAAIPRTVVVAGLRNLLGLPAPERPDRTDRTDRTTPGRPARPIKTKTAKAAKPGAPARPLQGATP